MEKRKKGSETHSFSKRTKGRDYFCLRFSEGECSPPYSEICRLLSLEYSRLDYLVTRSI